MTTFPTLIQLQQSHLQDLQVERQHVLPQLLQHQRVQPLTERPLPADCGQRPPEPRRAPVGVYTGREGGAAATLHGTPGQLVAGESGEQLTQQLAARRAPGRPVDTGRGGWQSAGVT